MRRPVTLLVVAALGLAGAVGCNGSGDTPATPSSGPSQAGGGPAGAQGRGRGAQAPMTVEMASASRTAVAESITVVGNLIGAATVQVVPRVNGRLRTVEVRLGDPVRRGQLLAKVEDGEVQEQVRQAEASYKVSEASIRQREADLKLAQTNLERSKSLYERQLLPQQSFDDVDSRYQAALAQLDLARAQFEQAKARLEELKVNLSNTLIVSPVDGFVGKRFLDAGAFASTNAPVAEVVDIRTVRMVANLVEKDLPRVPAGTRAAVQVDAFPGQTFAGRVGRVAPVFDPATRTAEMEIEIPNGDFRLKPGMYARVQLTVGTRDNALTVPSNALVSFDGKPGVFVVNDGAASDGPSRGVEGARGPGAPLTVKFMPVGTGIRDGATVEITSGLPDGARVVTTGAGALKDGDTVLAANAVRGRDSGPNGSAGGARTARGGEGR